MTVRDLYSPKDRLLRNFSRGPTVPIPFETVNAAFLSHVRSRPKAEAVQDLSTEAGRTVSYEKLAHYAANIATRLRENGVKPGSRVPLVAKRSLEMVAGILGILFAGAQYIPMDGAVVSDATLAHVLGQSGSDTVLTLRAVEKRLDSMRPKNVLLLEDLISQAASQQQHDDHAAAKNAATAQSGCYVIYTSGRAVRISRDDALN